MKLSRRTTTATALAVLALGGTLAATTPATATTTAAGAYNGACGEGYRVTASTPIKSSQTTTIGTTYITWNTGAQRLCAVTIRNNPGAKVFMEVTLDTFPDSTTTATDSGYFTTYAGPVYKDKPAAGECLTWSGTIGINYNGDTNICD